MLSNVLSEGRPSILNILLSNLKRSLGDVGSPKKSVKSSGLGMNGFSVLIIGMRNFSFFCFILFN